MYAHIECVTSSASKKWKQQDGSVVGFSQVDGVETSKNGNSKMEAIGNSKMGQMESAKRGDGNKQDEKEMQRKMTLPAQTKEINKAQTKVAGACWRILLHTFTCCCIPLDVAGSCWRLLRMLEVAGG